MQVSVNTRNLFLPAGAWEAVSTRAGTVFRRLGRRVRRVEVTLRGDGQGRGSARKECLLQAELDDGRRIVVVERAGRMRTALAVCLRKARRLVRAELRRRRQRRDAGAVTEHAAADCAALLLPPPAMATATARR